MKNDDNQAWLTLFLLVLLLCGLELLKYEARAAGGWSAISAYFQK